MGVVERRSGIARALGRTRMPHTYSQIYYHIVFAVKGRRALLPKAHRNEIYRYISGIVSKRGQKLLSIGGVGDHVHILLSTQPSIAVSDLVRDIKAGSSGFINDKSWIVGRFSWQEGFGAFSFSRRDLSTIAHYVERQEEHHAKRKFLAEYVGMLQSAGVEYESQYLFKPADEE